MSAHKTNPVAALHQMLPPLLPHGYVSVPILQPTVVPALGIMPYPADKIRKLENGRFEILVAGENGESWEAPPDGVKVVHPIGEPLPPELCDVVLVFGTAVQDALTGSLVTASGQPPRYRTSQIMHGELARMPLVQWQEAHLAKLRGQVA